MRTRDESASNLRASFGKEIDSPTTLTHMSVHRQIAESKFASQTENLKLCSPKPEETTGTKDTFTPASW